jgi:hypothetical protein
VGHRCGQFYVSESLTPDLGLDYLHAALFTYYAAMLHAFVLAAITLIILYRPENLGTEKTVSLRLECPVVNGLRLLHFAMGPIPDLAGGCKRNSYCIKIYRLLGFGKKAKQFFHVSTYLLK